MKRPDIIKVWGKADNFDIEFTHIEGIRWECSIPPDTSDGVYAVELIAMNSIYEMAHWTGELFMCSGMCHLKLKPKKYLFWVKVSDYDFRFKNTVLNIQETRNRFNFSIPTKMIIRKGCEHR